MQVSTIKLSSRPIEDVGGKMQYTEAMHSVRQVWRCSQIKIAGFFTFFLKIDRDSFDRIEIVNRRKGSG